MEWLFFDGMAKLEPGEAFLDYFEPAIVYTIKVHRLEGVACPLAPPDMTVSGFLMSQIPPLGVPPPDVTVLPVLSRCSPRNVPPLGAGMAGETPGTGWP
jgi:hypothetical protein